MGAVSDCEAISAGLTDQPVNAVSSLAFVVAAGWMVLCERRPLRAAATAAVGLGSVWFHGDVDSSAARWMHDGSLVALAVAAMLVAVRRPVIAWRRLAAAAVVAIVGVVVHGATRTGRSWCDPNALLQGHALWHVLAAVALTLASSAVRDKPGSPD
jgi:hypothetical protein